MKGKHLKKTASVLLCLAVAAVCFSISSCGRKGPPVPPGTLRPKAIDDLSYTIQSDGIELNWTIPVRNRDGSPLPRIKAFELFKAESPLEDACAECPPQYEPPIVIPFNAKPEEARNMYYEDRTLVTGNMYTYQVRTVKGLFNKSDLSNKVSIAWHVPPDPPADLVARAVRNATVLSWKPPQKWADGTPVDSNLVFRVYRSRMDEDNWKAERGFVSQPEYLDPMSGKSVQYKYRVTAVMNYYGTLIESLPSRDTTPHLFETVAPEAPTSLVGVSSDRGVELLWQENAAADVAGYLVYRKGPDGLIDRLNHDPVTAPRFVDRTVLPGGRYEYWVTAVDGADPPNESLPSAVVKVNLIGAE
ncbi:MAG TPA: hypothetical protein EYP57_07330 [Thermodesulfobacteriaceae bacterium]|nr:hypothetical protein [Thermodesulfobacteriaceae bacterium]